jgi:hypothetical protein
MKHLGTVKNRSHDGSFIIICDANAEFGGWDEHGEQLADEGSCELRLSNGSAFVEEAYGGAWEVCLTEHGEIRLTNPGEDVGLAIEELGEPQTERAPMGHVDVPSGELVVATAYPPLNTTSAGDHAGQTHQSGEVVRINNCVSRYSVSRVFTAKGNFVCLQPED